MSQIAYWGLALLALLQFFVCLPMSGIWGWLFRFPITVVGWSVCWFVIAKLHNLVADDIWQLHVGAVQGDLGWPVNIRCSSLAGGKPFFF